MSLPSGTRIGPYDIAGAIGAGGMGEVYRARDTKLGRDVALKALPATLAADSDRLGRFHREAQVLAALNHPNIAQIHGFEDSGSTHALVHESGIVHRDLKPANVKVKEATATSCWSSCRRAPAVRRWPSCRIGSTSSAAAPLRESNRSSL
jgi:serine/threonine protein kinase